MDRDVFVLASPLQALNAIEAHAAFAGARPVAILIESVSPASNAQIRAILEEAGWQDLRPIHIQPGRIRKRYTNVPEVVEGLRSTVVRHVFIGFYEDVFLHLAHTIGRRGDLYLLDDGVATISLNHARMNDGLEGLPVSRLRRLARNWFLRAVDRFRLAPIDTLRYFTVYRGLREDACNIVRVHDMARLRSRQAAESQSPEAWFLGLGSERIFRTQDLYVDTLRQATGQLAPARVRYIPHRYESPAQVERIRGECGVDILTTDAPIELYLSRLATVPATVCSLISSALYTVGVLFPGRIGILSYRMDLAHVRKRYHRQFRVIYDYYEACPFIQVIHLEPSATAGSRS